MSKKKIGKAKWLVDEFIKNEFEDVELDAEEKEVIKTLVGGYKEIFNATGVTDKDDRIDLLKAWILAGYLYIEELIDEEL